MKKRPEYYILKNGKPIPVENFMIWAMWFEKNLNERIVASNIIKGVHVSTVFMGLNHAFRGARPLIYETMIFGGERDGECYRYSTAIAAKHNHKKIVDELKESLKPNDMTNEEIIRRVEAWQHAGFVHELTCGYNSTHDPLIPMIVEDCNGRAVVKLTCCECAWIQDVPEMILRVTPEEIQAVKDDLKSKGFKFND